jgi:membrane protein
MVQLLTKALRRIFPGCIIIGQAIAFSMFLGFFPLLLLAIGLLGETSLFREALREIPEHLVLILPPGTTEVVSAYFVRPVLNPWRWIGLGTAGTILAGSQVMMGYVEGFRIIEGDPSHATYLQRQARALRMLCVAIVPMLVVVVLTVFGRDMRAWLLHFFPPFVSRELELALYVVFVFVLAMAVLMFLYRSGRSGHPDFLSLFPGAAVATVLWWTVDVGFGWYVRMMPYTTVYRGLAAAIGLLLWMFLTAIIVLLGAAYNAERREMLAAAPERRIHAVAPAVKVAER